MTAAVGVIQISDRRQLSDDELLGRIARGAPPLTVQLRDPTLGGQELLAWGRRLRDATRRVGAKLVVNDRLDLALLLAADGLHLGRHSMPVADVRAVLGETAWVSCSAHQVSDVVANARRGADASLLSPIFVSPGKGAALGLGALSDAREALGSLGHAVYALGGVTPERVAACMSAGASGVASIRSDLVSLAA
jgi:thiamine-phosphate pyrophosphorylase